MSSSFVPPRNISKCLVERAVAPNGEAAVRKSPRGGVFGRWLSSWLLRRETVVLERLQHLECVPRVLATGPDGLLIEFVEGRSLSDVRRDGIPRETARRVNDAVATLHGAGIAHGALGRRDILVAEDGRVVIIDFATAIGPGAPPVLGRLLVGWVQRRDRARLGRMLATLRARHEGLIGRDG